MTNAEKVAAEVARVCDGTVIDIQPDVRSLRDGVVLVRRPRPYDPYVCWRYVILAGDDAALYAGRYVATLGEALADFMARAVSK